MVVLWLQKKKKIQPWWKNLIVTDSSSLIRLIIINIEDDTSMTQFIIHWWIFCLSFQVVEPSQWIYIKRDRIYWSPVTHHINIHIQITAVVRGKNQLLIVLSRLWERVPMWWLLHLHFSFFYTINMIKCMYEPNSLKYRFYYSPI